MKKLAAFSLAFVLTLPADAAPGIRESFAYIVDQCEDASFKMDGALVTKEAMTLNETRFSMQKKWQNPSPNNTTDIAGYALDIRRVSFSITPAQSHYPEAVSLTCTDSCISAWTVIDVHGKAKKYNSKQTRLDLICHQNDRVLNAFRHLQTLLGGPIDDPCAN